MGASGDLVDLPEHGDSAAQWVVPDVNTPIALRLTCEATTKDGTQCAIEPDRLRDGKWLCHIHDPEGVFRANQKAMRQAKRDKRKARRR